MDAQGLQTILHATPAHIQMLVRKLESGYRFPFLLQLGEDFSPSAAPAFLRRAASEFELSVETPLRYRGTNAELRRFVEHGRHAESTLTPIFAFIRKHFATEDEVSAANESELAARPEPCPAAAARKPLRDAAEITDLDEARRRLEQRGTSSRVLLDREKLLRGMRQRIHGQDAVLNSVSERVCVELARSDRRQPLSLFFFGPSGVGKTETALALADVLSSDEIGVPHRLVRHNMNEYQERHSAYRFVGAPPSYVGYGDEPLLFQERRFSNRLVVVFDEIEKAHPDILKTLMSLIDTGELSCPAGGGGTTTAEFRECILIFTSNLGGTSTKRLAERGLPMDSVEFQIAARDLLVTQRVPVEIAGRMRSLVLFRELESAELLSILADKIQMCGQTFGLTVRRISPVLLAHLAAQVGATQFGVRMAEQLVDQVVAGEFARHLLSKSNFNVVEVTSCDGKTKILPA